MELTLPELIKLFGPFDRIVCFEANPDLGVLKPQDLDADFEVIRSAVWTENSELRFFFGEHNEQSSVMENKRTGNFSRMRSATVPAVDFADWIDTSTSPDDALIVKMDIEGAEFDVLERLAAHPTRKRITRLLVEWHNNRLAPRWRYAIRRRVLEIRYYLMGLPIHVWRRKSIPELS